MNADEHKFRGGKNIVGWVIPSIFVCLLLISIGCEQKDIPKDVSIDLAGESFRMDLAVTRAQISKGMMGRATVDDHEGMLFVFPDEKVRSFWMMNCLVPLDGIFVDKEGRIVSIRTMPVPTEEEADNPPSYSSRWPAQFVIELRAGRAEELKLEPGQTLELPIKKLKYWAGAKN